MATSSKIPIPTITQVFTSDGSHLCIDSTNALWVMGDNKNYRLGTGVGKYITDPHPTGLVLDPNEHVLTFYACRRLALVHTSLKRLFITSVHKQSVYSQMMISASNCEYFYESSQAHTDAPAVGSSSAQHPDYWPAPHTVSFATAYVGSDPIENTELVLDSLDEGHDSTETQSVPASPRLVPISSDLDSIDEWLIDGQGDAGPRVRSFEVVSPVMPDFGPGRRTVMASSARAAAASVYRSMISNPQVVHAPRFTAFDSDSTGVRIVHASTRPRVFSEVMTMSGGSGSTGSDTSEAMSGGSISGISNRSWATSSPRSSDGAAVRHLQNRLESEHFGTDLGAALEADGHDFGLINRSIGSFEHYYNNKKLSSHISDRMSTVLADTVSFIPPLLEVDEITCTDETVFFRRGDTHYVYNWYMKPSDTMMWSSGLSLSPTQHHRVLTYYQINWPFIPEVIQYCDNFVYARTGITHHVLTSLSENQTTSRLIWVYFPLRDLDPKEISVSLDPAAVYVHQGDTIYEYLQIVQGLRPIISDRNCFMFHSCHNQGAYPYCLGTDGSLMDYVSKITESPPDLWLEHTVNVRINTISGLRIVVVDVDSPVKHKVCGSTLLINVHNCWYSKHSVISGIMCCDADGDLFIYSTRKYSKSPQFQLIEKIQVDSKSYYLYKWIDLPKPLDAIQVAKQSIIFQSGERFFKSMVTSKIPQKPIEMLLANSRGSVCVVDRTATGSITRAPMWNNSTSVRVETVTNLFLRLCSFAEIFDASTKLSISYTRKTNPISHGNGVTRVFMQDALSQFAVSHLIQKGASTVFNLEAWRCMNASEIFYAGKALAVAMKHIGNCLPVRLPLAVAAAIAKREPRIEELEYFLLQTDRKLYETITSYYDDPEGLKATGYDTYLDALHQCTHYNNADSDTNQFVSFVSRVLVDGFESHMGSTIESLRNMNLPTIDYFLSGDYVINREQLKQKINSSGSPVHAFVFELISTLPERKLAILLRNWSGSSTVLDNGYSVGEISREAVHFGTCAITLSINPQLLGPDSSIPRSELIDILTTPVTFINN